MGSRGRGGDWPLDCKVYCGGLPSDATTHEVGDPLRSLMPTKQHLSFARYLRRNLEKQKMHQSSSLVPSSF